MPERTISDIILLGGEKTEVFLDVSDGSSDLTASFLFGDGCTASLVWFFSSGGYIYNAEFSQLPGDASMGE